MYLHFGKNDALTRMAQDTVRGLEASDQANKQFDERLAKEKKKAKNRLSKVLKANAGISRWNADHPDQLPKPLLEEPHVPRLRPTGIDLRDRIADFNGVKGQALPVSEVVDALAKLGAQRGLPKKASRLFISYIE